MKSKLGRFIAIIALVIPGILATYGFLQIKNALFDYFASFAHEDHRAKLEWVKLILGFVYFFIGIAFIGGWLFFRDQKRNYVAPRFKAKRKK